MGKYTLFMRVELDVDGNGTVDEIREATLKAKIGDIETGLINDNGIIEVLETNHEEPTNLMENFVNIIKRRGV